jgi:hypothetical protein
MSTIEKFLLFVAAPATLAFALIEAEELRARPHARTAAS